MSALVREAGVRPLSLMASDPAEYFAVMEAVGGLDISLAIKVGVATLPAGELLATEQAKRYGLTQARFDGATLTNAIFSQATANTFDPTSIVSSRRVPGSRAGTSRLALPVVQSSARAEIVRVTPEGRSNSARPSESVSGPVSIAIDLMLAGNKPPTYPGALRP
jgi:hypothetical protein